MAIYKKLVLGIIPNTNFVYSLKPPEKSGGFLLIDIKNLIIQDYMSFMGKKDIIFNKNL